MKVLYRSKFTYNLCGIIIKGDKEQRKNYRGFISYAYADNDRYLWLKKNLEGLKIPKNEADKSSEISQARHLQLFNEEKDYNTGMEFIESNRDAVNSSDYLFLICSENSAFSYEINEDAKYCISDSFKGQFFLVLLDNTKSSLNKNIERYIPDSIREMYLKDPNEFNIKVIDIRGLSGSRARNRLYSVITGKPDKYFKIRKEISVIFYSLLIIISALLFYFLYASFERKIGYISFYSAEGEYSIMRDSKSDKEFIRNLTDIVKNDPQNNEAVFQLLSVLSEKVYPSSLKIPPKTDDGIKQPGLVLDRSLMLYSSGNRGEVWDLNKKTQLFDIIAGEPDKKAESLFLSSDKSKNKIGDSLTSFCFSIDGKYIVSGSKNGRTRIWDTQSGRSIGKLMQCNTAVISAGILTNNSKIITLSSDNLLRLWNFEDSSPEVEPIGFSSKAISFEVTADDKWLIVFLENRKASLVFLGNELPSAPAWLLELALFFSSDYSEGLNGNEQGDHSRLYKINTELYSLPPEDVYAEWGKWFLKKYFSKRVYLTSKDFILKSILKIEAAIYNKLVNLLNSENKIKPLLISKLAREEFETNTDEKSGLFKIACGYAAEYAARLEPYIPEIWYNKGIIEYGNGHTGEAFHAFYTSIYLKPDYWESWNYLGNLWMEIGGKKNSAESLRNSLNIVFKKYKSTIPGYDYALIGSQLMDLGDRQYSLLAFKKELEKNLPLAENDDPASLEKLAISYGNLAFAELFNLHSKEAVLSSLKGLKVDSTQLWLYINLSHSYVLDNQFKKAGEIYRKYGKIRMYDYDNRTLGEVILGDLEDLKKNGLYHPDMEKIKDFFSSRQKKISP